MVEERGEGITYCQNRVQQDREGPLLKTAGRRVLSGCLQVDMCNKTENVLVGEGGEVKRMQRRVTGINRMGTAKVRLCLYHPAPAPQP